MKISIITVCLNDLNGLKETFKSIQNQTSDKFEWCVIDGNSNDGTVPWLKEKHKFNGSWISEPDNDIYDAMNKGIVLAEGEYLLFINSGDMLAGIEVLSKLIKQIEGQKTAPDFVYGDSLDVYPKGRFFYRKALPASYINFGMIARHQSMLYRKKVVLHERYPSGFKFSGDYALTANLLMKDDLRILKVDFPICLFPLGGIHDTHRLKALIEDFNIRKKILKINQTKCVLLFCVHLLHHFARKIFPTLNRKLIYRS